MIRKELCTAIRQEKLADSIYKLTFEGLIADFAKPGQFVHIKTGSVGGPLLRRPISIAEIDRASSRISIIYRIEGTGTALLSRTGPGVAVDILGPLGNGFPLEAAEPGSTALLVGGGIGVPPLYELSRQLSEKGVKVIHILGFQSASAVFYEEEFRCLGDTYISTADGSYGEKGFVTDVLDKARIGFTTLFACGPNSMLKVLAGRYPDKNVFLSLEERMACGIGACFACVCKAGEGEAGKAYRKVCSDGPVFRAGEVVL